MRSWPATHRTIPALVVVSSCTLLACGDGGHSPQSSGSDAAWGMDGSAGESGGNGVDAAVPDVTGADSHPDTDASTVTPLPMFRVAPSGNAQEVWLWVDPAWQGWSTPPDAIHYRVGAESHALPDIVAGLHRLTGVSGPADVSIAIERNGNVGSWSSSQSVTPAADDFYHWTVWSDDARHEDDLPATVTHLGEDTASADNINRPLKLSHGAELEYVGGSSSRFVTNFAHIKSFQTDMSEIPKPVPEQRGRHFEPAGAFDSLGPLETQKVALKVRATADTQDRDLTLLVLGGAGNSGQRALSAVGLDMDGDPVPFRFDRPHWVSYLPSGEPCVQGPVRLLRNTGTPITIEPGRWVLRDGARLAVVSTLGQVPPPSAQEIPDLGWTYTRFAPTPANWDTWAAPAEPTSTGITLVPQFESLHVYAAGLSATTVSGRFRATGTTEWMPMQPLRYDARTPPDKVAEAIPGKHRQVIKHLAPDTEYEVQIKDGSTYRGAKARTLSYKTPKDESVMVGQHDSDYTINEGGSASAPREYRQGRIRGTLFVNASNVVIREVDVL